jgi:HD-like signal output (HDOD) protein
LPKPADYQGLVESPSYIAFEFVRGLAGELSSGRLDLPSFPEIAVRIRKVLADSKSSIDQVVRIVGAEPVLAARLLRIANSASLNRSGRPVTELRTAISRIGYNMVRSASMSFSLNQMRHDGKLAAFRHYLNDLWERSTSVAAYCYVLARNCSRVNPDEALLTGMMHGIGKLYILTRATDHPGMFGGDAELNAIIENWHASIGKAILENWEFPDVMAQAVGDQADSSRAGEGAADLADVVAVAVMIASYGTDFGGLEFALQGHPGARRLGLDEAKTLAVMQDSAAEVTALTQALGG